MTIAGKVLGGFGIDMPIMRTAYPPPDQGVPAADDATIVRATSTSGKAQQFSAIVGALSMKEIDVSFSGEEEAES